MVIPPPWTHIDLGNRGGAEQQVMGLVDRAMEQLPRDMPPDQVGPMRRSLARRISGALEQARESGGIELFLPTETWHGFHNGSSFIVAEVEPDVRPPAEVTAENYPALVMGEMLERPAARAVHTANSIWVRTERVHPPDVVPEVDVPTVSVDYLTPAPQSPGSWIGVMFSTVGDGDPASQSTRLSVELFDAIMSTWTWIDP
ncbi:hypothetical protein [Oryzihumus leptocrescens]|uniref:hypothetical protein n=1 Tax=Oryzihumus leptocrescens TaxID=297536 RepID=UPI00114E7F09|nr:hypothetical protein [Oryzihumus leptocrescens]